MLVLVSNEVEKVVDKLQVYRGWLPFQFDSYLDLDGRHKFLESIGLEDEVQARNEEVMQGIRDYRPNEDVYLDKLLKQWLMENPQFSNLAINVDV